ncbi:MAG: hypothetical protein AAFV01_09300, partial [Bacteroidota bacterium]
ARERLAEARRETQGLARRAQEAEARERAALEQAIRELIGPQWVRLAQAVEEEYSFLVDLVNQEYADLGLDLERDFEEIRALELTTRAEIGRYEEEATQLVARRTWEGILAGDSTRELGERLRGVSEKVDRYADTLGKSQLWRYQQTLVMEKARVADVVYFEYYGIVSKGTRPFCRAMVGQTCHIDTIAQLRNANREPVQSCCGGWNCRHSWIPDPFATEQSDGRLIEVPSGRRTLVAFVAPGRESVLS